MKKLLSVVLATLMLLSVFPLALPQSVTAETTPERIAYLDVTTENATGELGDPEKPYATFADAYNDLANAGGGKLLLVSSCTLSGSVNGLATHPEVIIITSNGDQNIQLIMESGATFKASGPVTFENIRIKTLGNAYFYGNFNHITMGDGITCVNSSSVVCTESVTGKSQLSVIGGAANVSRNLDTHVTIKSGAYRMVVGGSHITVGTNNTATYYGNGTYRLDIEGGAITIAYGAHWSDSAAANLTDLVGGESQVNITDGLIQTLYVGTGRKGAQHYSLLNSTVSFTGGHISDSLRCSFTSGSVTIVYGGSVAVNPDNATYGTEEAFYICRTEGNTESRSDEVLKTATGFVDIVTQINVGINILPASTSGVVYLNKNAEIEDAVGTEDKPVKYLNQAIAMLSQTGGTIKLVGDYTFDEAELNSLHEFNEFTHNGNIVIDGGSEYSLVGILSTTRQILKSTGDSNFSFAYGLASYNLNGNTTFANLIINTPKGRDLAFCAHFNSLTMDNVSMPDGSDTIRLIGGTYSFDSHFNYTNSYNGNYCAFGTGNPTITVNSGNYGAIICYSRFAGNNGDTTEIPFKYPGKATVNIGGTATAERIYLSSYGSDVAHNLDVEINLYGESKITDAVYFGGGALGSGTIDGNIIIHQYDDAWVNRYGTDINNYTKQRTITIDSDYATYISVKSNLQVLDRTEVVTNILAPEFGDAEFGVRYDDTDSYSLRYVSNMLADYFVGEGADDYNIVELGVLVKTADNENAFKYVQGKDSYRGISQEEGVNNVDIETKIAKSVIYIKDMAIDNYMWAGEGDATVDFVAPLVGLNSEYYGTEFVFCTYIVVTDVNGGRAKALFGTPFTTSIGAEVAEILDGADPENYTAKQAIAAKIYAENAIAY